MHRSDLYIPTSRGLMSFLLEMSVQTERSRWKITSSHRWSASVSLQSPALFDLKTCYVWVRNYVFGYTGPKEKKSVVGSAYIVVGLPKVHDCTANHGQIKRLHNFLKHVFDGVFVNITSKEDTEHLLRLSWQRNNRYLVLQKVFITEQKGQSFLVLAVKIQC